MRYVSTCDVSGFFWQFATWLVTQDLHKSHNGMIFSNKACLLLDFSCAFQNVSLCEIMWKIKQSLFIYLSGYGSCRVCQAWCHARRRRAWLVRLAILFWFKHYRINFCDKLRFLLDPKYLSRKIIFIIESHKIKFQSIELPRNIWEWASERTVLYYFVCPIFTLLSDILQIFTDVPYLHCCQMFYRCYLTFFLSLFEATLVCISVPSIDQWRIWIRNH